MTEDVIALSDVFLAAAPPMNHPAYWKFGPVGKRYFLLWLATQDVEPSRRAYTNGVVGPIMSAMASRGTQWTAQIESSASRPRLCVAATGSVSKEQGAAPARGGCYPPGHAWRRGDLGRRWSGTVARSPGSLVVSLGGPSVVDASLGLDARLAATSSQAVDAPVGQGSRPKQR